MSPKTLPDALQQRDARERQTLAALIIENPELGISLHAAMRDRKVRDRIYRDSDGTRHARA